MYPKRDYEALVDLIRKKVKKELKNYKHKEIRCLNLQVADKLAKEALKKAESLNINIAVSIIDKHGNLMLLNRMENSVLAAIEVSIKKAYTSAVLGIPSSEVLTSDFDKLVESLEGKIVAFGGGLPIKYNGEIIGSIGVSGGRAEEDVKIAEYAINAVLN